jgi:hypothetical protein
MRNRGEQTPEVSCFCLKFLRVFSVSVGLIGNRKHPNGQTATPAPAPHPNTGAPRTWGNGIVNPSDIANPQDRRWSGSTAMSNDLGGDEFTPSHVPHPICKPWTTGVIF